MGAGWLVPSPPLSTSGERYKYPPDPVCGIHNLGITSHLHLHSLAEHCLTWMLFYAFHSVQKLSTSVAVSRGSDGHYV